MRAMVGCSRLGALTRTAFPVARARFHPKVRRRRRRPVGIADLVVP